MAIRVGINGFGRIGRQILRAAYRDPDLEWVAVNDITSPATLAHLFKHDSIHGRFAGEVRVEGDRLVIEGRPVQVLAVSLVLLLPFAGIPLHLILRPPQTLAERYERELEQEYLRRDIEEKYVCPECQRPIEPDFILGPHCQTELRRHCDACHRVIDLTWSICPYCGTDGAHASRQAPTIPATSYPALQRAEEISRS